MKKSWFLWALISWGIASGIFGCQQSSKKESQKIPQNSDTTPIAPPYDSPPGVEMTSAKRCFNNQGLTYDVTILFEYKTDTSFTGKVISHNLETDLDETTLFSGRENDGQLTISFEGKPPMIGAASEWLSKPWRIVKSEGKSSFEDMLHIPVKAKNYETNKWEESEYEFTPGACK